MSRSVPWYSVLLASLVSCTGCADDLLESTAPTGSTGSTFALAGGGDEVLADTTLEVGQGMRYKLPIAVSTRSLQRATLYSTAASVASVTSSGFVTAVAIGSAHVVFRAPEFADSILIKVVAPSAVPTPPQTPVAPPQGPPSVPPASPPADGQLPADWATGAAIAAALPRMSVDTAYPILAGRKLRVNIGQRIQPALDSARYGDEIVLQAGGTWVEGLVLPSKNGSGWIVVRSDTQLPTDGQRVNAGSTGGFAKILAPNNSTAAVRTAANASGWRLVGLEISAAPAVSSLNNLLRLGDPSATSVDVQPRDIVLDRMYIHGTTTLLLTRCIQLHTRDAAILHSVITECHTKGQDSQAIVGWNGPGPYLIANNYLAGAGENVMFGGATPSIPNMLPCDITITGNHFDKPRAWRGVWLVKNLFEVKFGCRMLIEDNLFENVWADGQTGLAINLKSSNNAGATWAETRDLTFRSNIIRNAAMGAFGLAAAPDGPAVPMSRITIVNNLMYKLGSASDLSTSEGRAITVLGGVAHVLISYNTIAAPYSPLAIYRDGNPPLTEGLTVRGNVMQRGAYGLFGSNGEGTITVTSRYNSYTIADNVIFGASRVPWNATAYPANTYFVADPNALFTNWSAWDLHLATTSAARTRGPNGGKPGASW